MFLEIKLDAKNQYDIDSHYVKSANDFVSRLSLKPMILYELKQEILREWKCGTNLQLICKKYIWH